MTAPPPPPVDVEVLSRIERRVLWLATRMIDAANQREGGAIKVGGHQASCASMVSVMTALWFGHIGGEDKVAVKPHASPLYHSIKYLTGELDRSYLTRLRELGGLQAYPSRTKDPDVSDYSTGSVGLGAVAPLFSALTRRYVDSHFGGEHPAARFISLVGDAELDEGNVWEAIADPATAGLGNFTMVIDLNRQSLDRVIPNIAAERMRQFFANAGWHVAEAKYGGLLTAAFERPGGDALRAHIDSMPNEEYQALFALDDETLRTKFLANADPAVRRLIDDYEGSVTNLVTDLGGHDLSLLLETFASCDREPDRPSVVFAYTVKGKGLPMAGDPLNHAALLSPDQLAAFRSDMGLIEATEWDRFDPNSPEGRVCEAVGGNINNPPPVPRPIYPVPLAARPPTTKGHQSTQDAFGRTLSSLADVTGVGERIVTTSPDVSISTNLGGWINKMGVYSPVDIDDHGGAERLLKWAPSPTGQHLELGISEMNLFMLLGQLGLSHDHHGQHLLPVGAVYDPFVLRGLDALIYGLYNGSRFIVAGTPSGVTLAPEGGAHQSTITASVGAELPGIIYSEPAYATEVDWLLCDSLRSLSDPNGSSAYLRLSSRPLDQAPFAAALERYGEDLLRTNVLRGGYRLIDGPDDGRDAVTIVTTGAMAPEALEAAAVLDSEGVQASVIHLTSPDRVYRSWREGFTGPINSGSTVRAASHLHRLIPAAERRRPIVSVHDAASHSLAWIGSAIGARQLALGVDRFGESGTIADLHRVTGISTDSIVNAALIAVSET